MARPSSLPTSGAASRARAQDTQRTLFGTKGLPGQMNLFADVGIPDELVARGGEGTESAESTPEPEPQTDLGKALRKSQGQLFARRYSSVASGTNSFLPGPIKNAKGGDMPFSQDEIQQLVEALRPTIQQVVDELIPAAVNADVEPEMPDPLDDDGAAA